MNEKIGIVRYGFSFVILILLGIGCSSAVSIEPIVPDLAVVTDEPVVNSNIILDYPIEGGVVTSPLTFTGTARIFENIVEWRILDAQFNELASGFTVANSAEIGQFGPFFETVFLPVITTNTFYLELFSTSAQDGSEQDLVSVELGILPVGQTTVKVFFVDGNSAPEETIPFIDFEKRSAQKTLNVAEFAIHELLKGPESTWASQYIPDTTTLNKLEINEGSANIFFLDSENENWCSGVFVEGMRYEQVAETLKQFDSVLEVNIYVNEELFVCSH